MYDIHSHPVEGTGTGPWRLKEKVRARTEREVLHNKESFAILAVDRATDNVVVVGRNQNISTGTTHDQNMLATLRGVLFPGRKNPLGGVLFRGET